MVNKKNEKNHSAKYISFILIILGVILVLAIAGNISKKNESIKRGGDVKLTIEDAYDKDHVPHALTPGPKRLKMATADNSGIPNDDPEYMADRQAVINKVTAYSFLIDEQRWDEWANLFADDVTFEVTGPILGTLRIFGRDSFISFTHERYPESAATRRHTMGNMHVAFQSKDEAIVRTYMLISTVPYADKLDVLTTGTYNVELKKRDGKWTITRFYIEVDAPLKPSAIPEGTNYTYVPDTKVVDALKAKLSVADVI